MGSVGVPLIQQAIIMRVAVDLLWLHIAVTAGKYVLWPILI